MVIVLAFAICNSFYGAYYIFRDQKLISDNQKTYLYPTACVFLVLNSSINAIIYGIFNKKFKKVFISKFLPCLYRERDYSTRESSRSSRERKLSKLILKKVPSVEQTRSTGGTSPTTIYEFSAPPQLQRIVSTEPLPLSY